MQILTSVQHAQSVVHHYPRAFNINLVLEGLAQQRKEPSPAQLREQTDLDDLQVAADWEAVVRYVENIDAHGLHGHTPFTAYTAGS